MLTDSSVLLVKAIYNYKASNNDELCLQKGDVITVTQALEGGWWEGTLNGVTGWFPSNYVKELKTETLKCPERSSNNVLSIQVPLSPNLNDLKMYRGIVFQDIVDTECNHLTELQNLISTYLNPLKETDILSEVEYSYLVNNLEEVCISSRILLQMLEDVKGAPSESQRIGGEFMRVSVYMKNIHLNYSSGHPRAASVIEKHRVSLSQFMEKRGGGILTLTTGLSKPFRRLEKYPALLLELLRHTPENHLDRGDTQRAAVLYRDIAAACASARKQKEMELEIMTENIKGWEGDPIQSLGHIVHLGSVLVVTGELQKERSSRFLVAFPDTLVLLSSKLGDFTYEGRIMLSSTTVRRLDPSEGHPYAFEISGSLVSQRLTVICASSDSLQQWLSVFPNVRNSTLSTQRPAQHMRTSSDSAHTLGPVQPHSSRSVSPEDKPNNRGIAAAARQVTKKVWPNWNLRPHPPMRASLLTQNEVKLRRSNSYKKDKDHESEGDLPVRQMIEAFSTYDRTRNTVPSATASAPPRLNFEEDKIIIDGFDGPDLQEKTLVDTVYMLKDQIQELKGEVSSLSRALSEEVAARKRLESLVLQRLPPTGEHPTSLEG